MTGDVAFNMAAYCIAAPAHAHPDKTALLVFDEPSQRTPEAWTFREIEAAVLAIAAGLRATEIAPGARIVVRLDNDSRYPLTVFGAMAAGLVPVLASSQLTAREVEFLIADSEAAGVVQSELLPAADAAGGVRQLSASDIDRMRRDGLRGHYAPTRADDPAFMIYTSGTTAEPKGVLHAHRSARGRRPMYQGWYGISDADRVLHAGAFNWTFTFGTGLADPWANAATAVVYTGARDPDVWGRLIRASGATMLAAVPGVYRQMLKYGDDLGDLGSLRHGLMAGEAPPPGLFEDWHQRTGRQIHEALGMSEVSTYISTSPTVPRRECAVGKPQPGRRVAILAPDGSEEPLGPGEEGLLAVHRSDPGLMLGYWKRPREEAEVVRGEWFTGGDLAMIDGDGYVFHRGRANDVMKALGYRVSPLEVEGVLAQHPDVAEVACAELRVRADVSVVGAFVVAKPGAKHDAGCILAFARERLAAYKCPRTITFVDALPRTPNGKIRRSALAGGG